MKAFLVCPRIGSKRDDEFLINLFPENHGDTNNLINFLKTMSVDRAQEEGIKCHKVSLEGELCDGDIRILDLRADLDWSTFRSP